MKSPWVLFFLTLNLTACATKLPSSPASPSTPTPSGPAEAKLQVQVAPIRAPEQQPVPIGENALGFRSPEAAGTSFCTAMAGQPADFIHRFYAPPSLADEHFRCASKIFACGEEAKEAGRAPMSCSAGEHARRGLQAMSRNLSSGLPEGVEMLSCQPHHIEHFRAPRGFFSKGDACRLSPDLRWARLEVKMEMMIEGKSQTRSFRARMVQLGAHGWFHYSH